MLFACSRHLYKTWPLVTSQAFSPWASPSKNPLSCLQPGLAFCMQSLQTAKNAFAIWKIWTFYLHFFKLSGAFDCDRRQAKRTGRGRPAIHGKETRNPLRGYGHQRQHILLHVRCIWHQYSKSLKGLHWQAQKTATHLTRVLLVATKNNGIRLIWALSIYTGPESRPCRS